MKHASANVNNQLNVTSELVQNISINKNQKDDKTEVGDSNRSNRVAAFFCRIAICLIMLRFNIVIICL